MSRRPLLVRACAASLLLFLVTGCAPNDPNPPAEGFNLAGSDAQAIAVADATMTAMGGRRAWDATRHLTWRFFGGRLHVWDKYTGNLRFEDQDLTVLMNLNTLQGRAWRAGVEVTDATARQEILHRTQGAWINDSYWLIMPYKLKDAGVTLTYVGEKPDPTGTPCDVLQLTFAGVGRTPRNQYHVYVNRATRLVSHWIYWPDAAVDEPRALGPWTDWQTHGQILLSSGRGERRHSDVAVFADLPAAVYTDPAAFSVAAHQR